MTKEEFGAILSEVVRENPEWLREAMEPLIASVIKRNLSIIGKRRDFYDSTETPALRWNGEHSGSETFSIMY